MSTKAIKVAWIAATIAVLALSLLLFDNKPNSDIDVFLTWSMLALSFPSGLACTAFFAAVAYVLHQGAGLTVTTSPISLSLYWIAMFLTGYLQWFVMVPRLVAKYRGGG